MNNIISVSNAQRGFKPTGEQLVLIEHAAAAALEYENFAYSAAADITLVGEARIRALNAEYRGVDRVTDVLSFPLLETGVNISPTPDGLVHLGDLAICPARAALQAAEYGHSIERELAFLTVHGVLHLLGYDHEGGGEREMFGRQEAILAKIGLTR